MKKILVFIAFHLFLKYLIKDNYKLRKKGILPDEWHWADKLSSNYGFYVSL